MTRIRKYFIWFFMLSKRLLRQWSFVILLCMIPVVIPLTSIAMSQESGILHIVLCNEGYDDKATEIIDSLMNYDGVVMFSLTDSREEAEKAVAESNADAAWVFSENYSENLDTYVSRKIGKPCVEIIERETNVSLSIAKEMLFGAMYEELSYSIYKNFVYSEMVSQTEVDESEVRRYYDELQRKGDIVEIERLNNKGEDGDKANYLTSPMRGILALMIVLCTLAAVMLFLREQAQGRFDWLPVRKRLAPAIASCLSASCLSSLAVFISIQFSNISEGFINELIPIILYAIATAGFCVVLSVVFRSPGKVGAMIPGIIIIMLALSPIFFNIKILKPVRLMLPTHYYLYSIYDNTCCLYGILYCIAVYSVVFLLNWVLSNRKYHKNIT